MQQEPLNIIVCCANNEILEVLLRVIRNKSAWQAYGSGSLNEIKCLLEKNSHFNLALIGSGFSLAEENELVNILNQYLPEDKILFHYGGGSGLLFNEVNDAFLNNVAV